MNTFNYDYMVNQGCGYTDWAFTDNSRKSQLRSWILTLEEDTGQYYAMLRRAKDNESEFLDDITVPLGIVQQMIALLPDEEKQEVKSIYSLKGITYYD